MFLAVGTDIEEIARFERVLQDKRMMKRCFTERERAYFAARGGAAAESAAAAFCAKEAFGKAVGTGITVNTLPEIEVLHNERGQPYLALGGSMGKLYADLTLSVSLSHSAHYAVATVLAYKNTGEAAEENEPPAAVQEGGACEDAHSG